MKKLDKKELKKKKKYHENRAKFYGKKIIDLETETHKIGFKYSNQN